MTVGCARCHNHKFDPFPQADYYRLQAFFAPTAPKEIDLATADERATQEKAMQAWEAEAAPLRRAVNDIDAPYRQRLTEAKTARGEPAPRGALATDPKNRTPKQQRRAGRAAPLVRVPWDEILDALPPPDRPRRAALRARLHALETHKPAPT